jgi:cellulose synthase/poly-beta-1,6-N-acetylglucosamine synthase-like glycosyltransferase
VDDWAFGLVTHDRRPKPALEVVARRFAESPLDRRERWPRVSVVVCNYNGGRTLRETLDSLVALDYPDYEVILVEDGSTDDSRVIAREFTDRFRVLEQENRGLSVARNVGAKAATGEIVAYIDSDAFADADWLRHLVIALESGDFQGVGGPNLTPASDGLVAQYIALCPGNPTHVLKDNTRAEHVAGVNMAFRREALLGLGGFDPVHRTAGDDVDICWRFEDAGMELAFAPAAIVWHHRRPSIRTYLRQQAGYGVAENQLERKHPERFNIAGYIRWQGRVYQAPRKTTSMLRPFIYHGRLGGALFQTLYQKDPSYFLDGPNMIQWHAIWIALAASAPFLSWWLLVVGLGMLAVSLWMAFLAGLATELPMRLTRGEALRKTLVIGALHFVHPMVRWWGRARARLGHVRFRGFLRVLAWLRPDRVLREGLARLEGRRQLRRYWGDVAVRRPAVIAEIQRALKNAGRSSFLGHEWDDHDILLNGSISGTGRVYTSPEHFDASLCVGYESRPTRFWRGLWWTTAAGAGLAAVLHPPLMWLGAIPLLLGWHGLGQRGRLRKAAWTAVEGVMQRHGAVVLRPDGPEA